MGGAASAFLMVFVRLYGGGFVLFARGAQHGPRWTGVRRVVTPEGVGVGRIHGVGFLPAGAEAVGVQVDKRSLPAVDDLAPIARTVLAVAREEQITLMAASLAYYLFTALVPLVLFSFIGLSLLGGDLLPRLLHTASGTVLPSGVSVPRSLLTNTAGRLRAATIGAVILAWSALRTFGALDGAFAAVYGEREEVSLVGKAIDAAVVFVTVALATATLAVVGVALALVVKNRLLLRVLSPLFSLAALAVVFVPLYYVLPEVDGISVAEILPGTLLAAVVWTVSGAFFRLYATASSSVHLYGVAGGVLLVLTWLYVGGLALLVGAALNAALAGRADPDAEWFPTEYR